MSAETQPTPSQFGGDDELVALSAVYNRLLEREYQDDCHVLRADILTKLNDYGVSENGMVWAVFYIEDAEENVSNLATVDGRQEVLIFSLEEAQKKPGATPGPVIRIITNELAVTEIYDEDKEECLSFDVTIWPDDDVSYFVDAMPLASITADNKQNYCPVFFVAEDGGLYFSGNVVEDTMIAATPIYDIKLSEGQKIKGSCTPMGNYQNIEDKIHALNVAKGIYSRVKVLAAEHHS